MKSKVIISRFTPDLPKVADKQESLEDVIHKLNGISIETENFEEERIIIASAFLYLKENPSVSIEDALNHGYNQWVK